jgi:hypothetical protein
VGSSAKTTSGRVTSPAGAGDPLLLTARQLRRPVPEPAAQPERSDDQLQPRPVRRAAADRQRQGDVLLGAQRRQQVEQLEDEADLLPAQPRQPAVAERADPGVTDPHLAAADPVQPSQTAQQRGLARPRRAHDRGEAATPEGRRHAGKRIHPSGIAAAVDLPDVHRPGGHPPPARQHRRCRTLHRMPPSSAAETGQKAAHPACSTKPPQTLPVLLTGQLAAGVPLGQHIPGPAHASALPRPGAADHQPAHRGDDGDPSQQHDRPPQPPPPATRPHHPPSPRRQPARTGQPTQASVTSTGGKRSSRPQVSELRRAPVVASK